MDLCLLFQMTKKKNTKRWQKKAHAYGKSLGALEYFECKGEDLIPKSTGGQSPLGFPALTKAKPDETVWFSFIVFKSRKHRDEVNAKMNAEMEKEGDKYKDVPMPFDIGRMAYGGFEVIVEG